MSSNSPSTHNSCSGLSHLLFSDCASRREETNPLPLLLGTQTLKQLWRRTTPQPVFSSPLQTTARVAQEASLRTQEHQASIASSQKGLREAKVRS